MFDLSRAKIISNMRDMYGMPENSPNGNTRGYSLLNLALAQLWRDLPSRLKTSNYAFRLEPPISGTATLDSADFKVWSVAGVLAGAEDETLDARWIELYDAGTERWVLRRIREAFTNGITTTLVLDEAWTKPDPVTTTSFRIFTLEYSLPAHVGKISSAWYDDGVSSAFSPLDIVGPKEIAYLSQTAARRIPGIPAKLGAGSAFKLQTPHFTPQVETAQLPHKWGYDTGGTEHGAVFAGDKYGAAGTFSYIACLGWGRRPWLHPTKGWGHLQPFYLSAPSLESAKITTTWGGPGVKLTLTDVNWQMGFRTDVSLPSYNRSGLKWWVYRARHATQSPSAAGNNAFAPQVEADGDYYLWRVLPASAYEVFDHGDSDPPDRDARLRDGVTQGSVIFDVLPTDVRVVRFSHEQRAEALVHDADTLPIPAEVAQPFYDLLASYLIGKRQGEPDTESAYYRRYTAALRDLQEEVAMLGGENGRMGNALPGGNTGGSRSIFSNLMNASIKGW